MLATAFDLTYRAWQVTTLKLSNRNFPINSTRFRLVTTSDTPTAAVPFPAKQLRKK